jgi:hypothetical protein
MRLEYLDLSYNDIKYDSCLVLADVLNNNKIKNLNLYCKILINKYNFKYIKKIII